MKNYIIVILIFLSTHLFAQNKDETIIRKMMITQEQAWNRGDITHFMEGYWENDSLVYIGKNGPTYGYLNTLNNYEKKYPDASYMGKLHFDVLSVKPLGKDYYFLIGKWQLTRAVGDVGGHFTLLFKKINGVWKIIADHSS
jgi:ketosteroid isomerase-like protein